MSDQDDNTTGFVLAVVLAVAALVIAGVLGLAIGTTRHHEAPAQAAVPVSSRKRAPEARGVFSGAAACPPTVSESLMIWVAANAGCSFSSAASALLA